MADRLRGAREGIAIAQAGIGRATEARGAAWGRLHEALSGLSQMAMRKREGKEGRAHEIAMIEQEHKNRLAEIDAADISARERENLRIDAEYDRRERLDELQAGYLETARGLERPHELALAGLRGGEGPDEGPETDIVWRAWTAIRDQITQADEGFSVFGYRTENVDRAQRLFEQHLKGAVGTYSLDIGQEEELKNYFDAWMNTAEPEELEPEPEKKVSRFSESMASPYGIIDPDIRKRVINYQIAQEPFGQLLLDRGKEQGRYIEPTEPIPMEGYTSAPSIMGQRQGARAAQQLPRLQGESDVAYFMRIARQLKKPKEQETRLAGP